MPDGPAERSGGDGLEAHVAVLEQIARSTLAALERLDRRFDRNDSRFDAIDRRFESCERRMDEGFRELRSIHDRDFHRTWAGIITLALGMGALMAHGFHWF